MSHFVPEIAESRNGLSDGAVNSNSDTFDFAILFNGFTHTCIFKDLREYRINPFDEIRGDFQYMAFQLNLGLKRFFNDLKTTLREWIKY